MIASTEELSSTGSRQAPEAAPDPTPAPPGTRRWAGVRAAAGFLLGEAVWLGLVRLWQPRFFYLDDKVVQYLPVWHWLGQHATWTGVPLVDPDQGSGGAFAADLQYGALDPFHWLLAVAISRTGRLNLAGWGLHVLAVLVLGLGVVALTRRLGARPGWAAVAALGAANSGFLIWMASSWWPAAWGTALLPWLWWALVGRSRWAVPTAVLSAYLLGASGYPYTLPFAALVVVGVLLEHGLRHGTWRLWRDRPLALRTVGAAGGLLLALPGLLAASAMDAVSARAAVAGNPYGNAGDFIPNLLDVLVGGPTTSGESTGWWPNIMPTAMMATGWFVLPLLALVPWRSVRAAGVTRVPGLVAGLVVVVGAAIATQTPTDIGSFRLPLRYAVVFQVFAPVLVVVLLSVRGLATGRRRWLVAAALCVGQACLAFLRLPVLAGWHGLAAALGVLTIAVVAWSVRRAPGVAVVAVAVMTVAAPLVGIGAAVGYHHVQQDVAGQPRTGTAAHPVWDSLTWPSTVGEVRAGALQPGLNATVLTWGPVVNWGVDRGMPLGSAPLYADMRVGYGYSSVGQAGWAPRFCQDFLGGTAALCDPTGYLLQTVPGTDRSWLEVLAKDELLLDHRTPQAVVASLGSRWRASGDLGDYTVYRRVTPTPGRITWTSGGVGAVTATSVGMSDERYQVSWQGDTAQRVVTRIPWWPGYRATLDGRPLAVQVVGSTAVAADLPPGSGSGELRIWFEPPHLRLGLAAAGLGVLLGVAALILDLRRRRTTL